MIKLKNVTKTYTKGNTSLTAVNNVTLTIDEGQFVAIVGKSGCGKSTMLNLIGGLDDLTAGSILYKDQDIATYTGASRSQYRNEDIGFIFQSYHLEPHFNIGMNVALPLIVAGIGKKEREKKAFEALDKMGLSDRIKVKPTELSGGEMQRVAIARAIINNPVLILADEPTGNLDTASGNMVMDYLKTINDTGVTIILVTHNMEHTKYCSRVITMSDGVIESDSYNPDICVKVDSVEGLEDENSKIQQQNCVNQIDKNLNNNIAFDDKNINICDDKNVNKYDEIINTASADSEAKTDKKTIAEDGGIINHVSAIVDDENKTLCNLKTTVKKANKKSKKVCNNEALVDERVTGESS